MREFRKSLICACRGFRYIVKNERNFRIELAIAFLVIFLIFIFKVKNWESVILVLVIMWVIVAELINTVLERVVDILKPRIHPYARLIKDMMAAVVLVSSLAAIIIGIIIFLPYFRGLFGG